MAGTREVPKGLTTKVGYGSVLGWGIIEADGLTNADRYREAFAIMVKASTQKSLELGLPRIVIPKDNYSEDTPNMEYLLALSLLEPEEVKEAMHTILEG
jgi:hypothetical protein